MDSKASTAGRLYCEQFTLHLSRWRMSEGSASSVQQNSRLFNNAAQRGRFLAVWFSKTKKAISRHVITTEALEAAIQRPTLYYLPGGGIGYITTLKFRVYLIPILISGFLSGAAEPFFIPYLSSTESHVS
jgi:hypothetical protein